MTITVDERGRTALHLAALGGQETEVRSLSRYAVLRNVQDSDGNTALMLAAQKGHLVICQILINQGADKTIVNREGETASHLAPLELKALFLSSSNTLSECCTIL